MSTNCLMLLKKGKLNYDQLQKARATTNNSNHNNFKHSVQ